LASLSWQTPELLNPVTT